MPIRCRECELSGLAHDLHATPEDLAHIRAHILLDVANQLGRLPEGKEFIEIGGVRFSPAQFRQFMQEAHADGRISAPWALNEAFASVALAGTEDQHDGRC